MTDEERRALLAQHTQSLIQIGMANALARFATEPDWPSTLDTTGTITQSMLPAAQEFMKYRGDYMVNDLMEALS